MTPFTSSVQLILLMFLAVGISCTIVEDADVRTPADLEILALKTIEVSQTTQAEGTKVAKLSAVLNNSGKLQQVSIPSFTGSKFKFRSLDLTGSATATLTYSLEGRVTVFDIQAAGVSKEKYLFEYDASGKLLKLTSIGAFPDGIVQTKDSITYLSEGIDKIFRSATSTGGTISKTVSASKITDSNNQVIRFNQFIESRGDCPNNSISNACTGYYENTTGGGGGSYSITIRHIYLGSRLKTLWIGESTDGSKQQPDGYAFHPLMVLRSEIPVAETLMIYYMKDWWVKKVSTQGNSGGTQIREWVQLNFLYGN